MAGVLHREELTPDYVIGLGVYGALYHRALRD
jgi:hypothetical protein